MHEIKKLDNLDFNTLHIILSFLTYDNIFSLLSINHDFNKIKVNKVLPINVKYMNLLSQKNIHKFCDNKFIFDILIISYILNGNIFERKKVKIDEKYLLRIMNKIRNVKDLTITIKHPSIYKYIKKYTNIEKLKIFTKNLDLDFSNFNVIINLEEIEIINDRELTGNYKDYDSNSDSDSDNDNDSDNDSIDNLEENELNIINYLHEKKSIIHNFRIINQFDKLRILRLVKFNFEINEICKLENCKILEFEDCYITDEKIMKFKNLVKLKILGLNNNRITKNGLNFIIDNFNNIEIIDISYNNLLNEDLVNLKKLNKLKAIVLADKEKDDDSANIDEEIKNVLYNYNYDRTTLNDILKVDIYVISTLNDLIENYKEDNKYINYDEGEEDQWTNVITVDE